MARYRILYWKQFPAQVKAQDDGGSVSVPLPKRFERALNVAAMVEGSISSDDYLDGWQWGEEQERNGDAQTVAEAVAAEIADAYSWSDLQKMVREYKARAGQG
jgi:hypothetical protein